MCRKCVNFLTTKQSSNVFSAEPVNCLAVWASVFARSWTTARWVNEQIWFSSIFLHGHFPLFSLLASVFVCSTAEPWLFRVQLGVQEFEWPRYLGRGNTLRSPMSSLSPADTRATTALSAPPSRCQRHRLHTSWRYCFRVWLQKFSFVVWNVERKTFVTPARVTPEITVFWRGKMSHWQTLSCCNLLCCLLTDLQRLEPIRFVVGSRQNHSTSCSRPTPLVWQPSLGAFDWIADNNPQCRVLSFSIHFIGSRISDTCCHHFPF